MTLHRVHGMDRGVVAPDWPPIDDGELSIPLSELGRDARDVEVLWRSPRPMSAGALVRVGSETVFVKRHHHRVRSVERLEREHRFAAHLRAHGVETPRALRGEHSSVAVAGDYRYEAYELASGHDRYRDVPSWHPYVDGADARGAGQMLARLHRAAASFDEPADDLSVLMDSSVLIDGRDPVSAIEELLRRRPGLARATASYRLVDDVSDVLSGPLAVAHRAARELSRQWTHGDWHPSNLTWAPGSTGRVQAVIDLGLANRTFAVHDLATAIERAVIDWLDVARRGAVSADLGALEALLDGYAAERPLHRSDLVALAAVLPVVHVEYALSEVEYFGDVVNSPANRDLAYHGYLLGHARWFTSVAGRALLGAITRRTVLG